MEFSEMIQAVRAFHKKHNFSYSGGEDMVYRMNLLMEELGEIAECVTKGRSKEELAEEHADLLILLLGNAIAADFDLEQAFRRKMDEVSKRPARYLNGRIRVMKAEEKDELSGK